MNRGWSRAILLLCCINCLAVLMPALSSARASLTMLMCIPALPSKPNFGQCFNDPNQNNDCVPNPGTGQDCDQDLPMVWSKGKCVSSTVPGPCSVTQRTYSTPTYRGACVEVPPNIPCKCAVVKLQPQFNQPVQVFDCL